MVCSSAGHLFGEQCLKSKFFVLGRTRKVIEHGVEWTKAINTGFGWSALFSKQAASLVEELDTSPDESDFIDDVADASDADLLPSLGILLHRLARVVEDCR